MVLESKNQPWWLVLQIEEKESVKKGTSNIDYAVIHGDAIDTSTSRCRTGKC